MSQVKPTLDKDLEKIVHVEAATRSMAGGLRSHGIAVIFLGLSALLAAALVGVSSDTAMVVVAVILGGYMALNIGANDVANNVGPAVGSRALTLVGALVIAAVFESAGALLAGGMADGAVVVVDAASGAVKHRIAAHVKGVRALAFSPDSQQLLVGAEDALLTLHDCAGGAQLAAFSGHASWVLCCAFSPDGRRFASGGADRRVKVWELDGRECAHTFQTAAGQVWALAYSPDSTQLVAVADDGSLHAHRVEQ